MNLTEIKRGMIPSELRINLDRLLGRLDALAAIGAIDGNGVCRMALSDEDRQGRDLVCSLDAGLPAMTECTLILLQRGAL